MKIDPYDIKATTSSVHKGNFAPNGSVWYIFTTVAQKKVWHHAVLINRQGLPKEQESEFMHSLKVKFANKLQSQLTS
jgi:hypothetical protein